MPVVTRSRNPSPGSIGPDGPQFSAEWRIEASSELHAIDLLGSQEGVYRGAPYVDEYGSLPDLSVVCQQISARGEPPAPTGGTGLYTVTAYFRRSNFISRPIAEPYGGVQYRMESSLESVPVDVDVNGWPIMNDAQEPIDPPLTMQRVHEVLVREWITFAQTFDLVYVRLRPYVGKLNSADYQGAPRGSLLCLPLEIDETAYPDRLGQGGTQISPPRAWRVRMRFDYLPPQRIFRGPNAGDWVNAEGWQAAFWQKARRKYVGGSDPANYYRAFRMEGPEGPIVTEPVPINTAGEPWQSGQARAIKTVSLYEYADFASIPSD